jgi:hypothetical protein
MFYELYIYCKVIFIICTIYTVILTLKISLTDPYLLACPKALKIIEPALHGAGAMPPLKVHTLPACYSVPAPAPHGGGDRDPWTSSTLTNFVNHFLLIRGAAVPVHECDILCGQLHGDYKEEKEDLSDAYKHKLDDELNQAACLWIRHAVANWQALVLRVCLQARRRLCLDHVPFASPLLTRVELTDATFNDPSQSIDFSRCPALEDLTMSGCQICSYRISSTSLAHLTIADCYFYGESTRTRISTPRLVSLQLCLKWQGSFS